MRTRLAASADTPERLVGIAMLLSFLCGCVAHGGLFAAAVVGTPLAVTAITGNPNDSGRLTAILSDGRVLEGTWSKVSARALPEAVVVETPRGLVSAAELVAPDSPTITGTLRGSRVRMVCAFVGDAYSGYRSLCADNDGTEWSGAFQRHSAFGTLGKYGVRNTGSSFYGSVGMRLQERR